MSSPSNKTYIQLNDSFWDNASAPNGSSYTYYVSPIAWRPFEDVPDNIYPIVGYVIPGIFILTLITNPLFMTILFKKERRSPMNCVLCALALSDMLTALFGLPPTLYDGLNGKMSYIPYNWCYFLNYTMTLSIAVHFTSVVLTVVLAMQRYIELCHKLVAHKWCTTRNTIIVIIVIWIIEIIFCFIAVFGVTFKPIEISRKNLTVIITCGYASDDSSFLSYWDDYYSEVVFIWVGITIFNFIPCIVLLLLTVRFILVMKNGEQTRRKLARENMASVPPINEANRKTLILVIIVAVFLLVEIPKGVLWCLYNIADKREDVDGYYTIETITNFLIVLSCPFTFFLYCVMSPHFRKSLKKNLFTCT